MSIQQRSLTRPGALFAALSDLGNLGIIAALAEHGEMTFGEIKDKFQIDTGTLHDRLTLLQNVNLVENISAKTDGPDFSYCDITYIANQTIESVCGVLYPLKSPFHNEFHALLTGLIKLNLAGAYRVGGHAVCDRAASLKKGA